MMKLAIRGKTTLCMSLEKSRFYWPGMFGDIEKMYEIVPDASGERLKER